MTVTSTITAPSNSSFYKEHCTYLPAMAGWFTFSVLLSLYNKHVFGQGEMAFPCPLTLTSIHFLIQWVVSFVLTNSCPNLFGGREIAQMSWKTFLKTSVSCGSIASLDIGFSNLALVHISLTFYTMVKASAPIFVLLFAFLFKLEQISCSLIGVIFIISIGELLTVYGEGADFDFLGFILCLSSSICSGMRWTLVQLQLTTLDPPLQSAVSTMRVLSPSMLFSLLIIALAIEDPVKQLGDSIYLESKEMIVKTILLALTGGTLAVMMVLCEFYLILKSSAIVLMIGGVVKELLTIIMGVLFFNDPIHTLNIFGCIIVFTGVLLYKLTLMYSKKKRQEKLQYELTHSSCTNIDISTDLDEDENGMLNGEQSNESDRILNKDNNENTSMFVIDDDDDDDDDDGDIQNGEGIALRSLT